MRILGIDCGSAATGYGIIESDGRRNQVVASGVIRTQNRLCFPQRLKQIAHSLSNLIEAHCPEVVAVEGIFSAVNARSALALGQVRGVALLVAAQAELPVHEYSPLEVKSSVVGYGRAEKSQVQLMVQTLLGLEEKPPEDAADALAVALCHAHRAQMARKLSPAATERTRPASARAPER
ncbi:MAG: crossover junction endodeoxyribonuclease RuvC [Acidobacteria bacterium RIFCSPLOWO2_02_FULL_59_13]|nr:MAG: crossover junction endodeoxyribonuclease RuvC [Acidobacteria bacterium RIFCSPLOWO2_02_FULL_59_13]